MKIAITREVSPTIDHCELTHLDRVSIDLEAARHQHAAYENALREAGCRVETLVAAPEYPDSVFVEDIALVFDELAIVTRPGAASRRGERESIAAAVAEHRERVERIEAPATLDGGDVLVLGRRVFVGLSSRTHFEGIEQLEGLLRPFGYRVAGVGVRDCLHLKSAVTAVGPETLLIQPRWIDPAIFEGCDCIEVDPAEPAAANVLAVNDSVIVPRNHPRTRERLEGQGFRTLTVDASELQKAEGAVTCCSLVFDEEPAR